MNTNRNLVPIFQLNERDLVRQIQDGDQLVLKLSEETMTSHIVSAVIGETFVALLLIFPIATITAWGLANVFPSFMTVPLFSIALLVACLMIFSRAWGTASESFHPYRNSAILDLNSSELTIANETFSKPPMCEYEKIPIENLVLAGSIGGDEYSTIVIELVTAGYRSEPWNAREKRYPIFEKVLRTRYYSATHEDWVKEEHHVKDIVDAMVNRLGVEYWPPTRRT